MRKFYSLLLSLSLLFNSFYAPLTILAQEATSAPEPTVQSVESSVATSEPTTESIATETPLATEVATTQPTTLDEPLLVTPMGTVSEESTPSPEAVNSPNPQNQITAQDTSTPVASNVESPVIETVIVENSNSDSIEGLGYDFVESSSATLITDRADYAPTDAVLITGTGYQVNKQYTIIISSSDDPAISHSDFLTANNEGNILYSYQLDGKYRPNYKVEIKDGDRLVITTTFTDSDPVYSYINDTAGANDEPGQKDLTKLGRDLTSSNPLYITWNWDEIEMKGNNTDDACALFDTNVPQDGLANYALCVTWEKDQSQISGSPKLYTCNNTKADRCAGADTGTSTIGSVCTVTDTTDDPFTEDDAYPRDTKATCSIPLSDVGGASSNSLLDVCSYPSVQPNSDPSDCIIIRTDKGSLTIVKDVDPNDSATNWNFAIAGPTTQNVSISGDGSTGILPVDLGTYSITETAGTGTNLSLYSTSWSCTKNGTAYLSGTGTTASSIVMGRNGNVEDSIVCTFTNTLQKGTIIVHKDVQGPEGENITDTSNNFSVQLDGGNTRTFTDGGSTTYLDLQSGNHTITESVIPAGYDLYGISTVLGGSGNTTGLTVNVVAGQTTNVYVTNRQEKSHLIVNKVTVPEDTQTSFAINASGTGTIYGTAARNITMGADVTYDLTAGTYSVTETPLTGWKEDVSDCTNVVVDLGETEYCTITNTQQGKIIVNKETTPNADSNSFLFSASYDADGFSLSDGQSNDSGFLNPGNYSVSENVPSGWTLSSSSCSDGSTADSIDLGAGETVTCTFNNTKLGKIIVEKQTEPDGSTRSFEFTPSYGTKFNLTDGQHNDSTFLLPGTYSVIEETVAGWDLKSAICSDGSLPGNIVLDAGETVTCTFTNTQRGQISGFKYEDLDGNLQTAGVNGLLGWTIELYGCTTSGFTTCTYQTNTTTAGDGSYSFVNLIPGYYQVREVLQDGWTNLTSLFRNITLGPGGSEDEENFTNFEKATIIVHKNVLDEFDQEINDTTPFDVKLNGGDTKSIWEGHNATYSNLMPGTYTITEAQPPQGYTFVSVTDPYDVLNDGVVTVQSGETYNVYVTNKQLPGSITITKQTSQTGTFNFHFSGDLGGFYLDTDSNDATYPNSITFSNLGAGSYEVTENLYAAWKLTDLVCVDPNSDSSVDLATRKATIDLDYGENITCTFTNSRKPKVNIIKHVITDNGGDAVASDFTINITGVNPSKTSILGDESGEIVYFDPGDYSIDEIGQTGYSKTLSSGCSGTLSYGDSKVCTITNNDQPGTLIVKKIIESGSKVASDYSFKVNGSNEIAFEGDGQNDLTVDAGTYSVVESPEIGYTPLYDNCSDLVVTNGGSQTCTITNTRDEGEIIIKKVIDKDGNLQTESDQNEVTGWQVSVNGVSEDTDSTLSGQTEFHTGSIKTGIYSASETLQSGYGFISASCSDRSSITAINLGKEETVTCTFYNTPNGTIHGYKWNDLDGEGDEDLGESRLGDWTINLWGWNSEAENYTDLVKTTVTDTTPGPDYGWYWFTHLFPGDYKVCEEIKTGWQQTYPGDDGCHYLTLPDTNINEFPEMANFVAESPVYNFGNVEDKPSIQIAKSNNKGSGALINDEVTYTLVITNTGNVSLTDVTVSDVLPAGIEYLTGTSLLDGGALVDPTVSSGVVNWNIGALDPDEVKTINYKAKVLTSAVEGATYVNYATVKGTVVNSNPRDSEGGESETIYGNLVNSSITLGRGVSYGGNLQGQVLGISTELPATGSPTVLIVISLLSLTGGLLLRRKYA